jgi:predicted GNAT family N-acyltransferase
VIEVCETRDDGERDAALALRERVFVDEQGVPLSEEIDGFDAAATHVVAVEDGAVIGTCRLVLDGDTAKLSRMVVARDHRRRGVGAALLAESDRIARGWSARRIVLNAQTQAMGVYASAGYDAHGSPFMDAGIEHRTMERHLEDVAARDERA